MKVRVCHILDTFGSGGIEAGLKKIVSGTAEDLEHVIVSFREGEHRIAGVSHFCLGVRGGYQTAFLKLAHTIRHIDPDVVHFRNYGILFDCVAASVTARRAKWVFGFHGSNMAELGRRSRFRECLFRGLSKRIDYITTLNTTMAREVTERLRAEPEKVYILPNGTSMDRSTDRSAKRRLRDKLAISDNTFIMGTVSRLDKVKNIDLLIAATKILRKSWNIVLVVVGDGPESYSLKKTASPEAGVVFLGHQSDPVAIMQGLDLYVQASWYEGFSNTILEAMAVGLPVLASNAGGNSELIANGKTGFLFPPDSLAEFVVKAEQLIRDQDLRYLLGSNGKRHVGRNYTLEKMVHNYRLFYSQVGGRP